MELSSCWNGFPIFGPGKNPIGILSGGTSNKTWSYSGIAIILQMGLTVKFSRFLTIESGLLVPEKCSRFFSFPKHKVQYPSRLLVDPDHFSRDFVGKARITLGFFHIPKHTVFSSLVQFYEHGRISNCEIAGPCCSDIFQICINLSKTYTR